MSDSQDFFSGFVLNFPVVFKPVRTGVPLRKLFTRLLFVEVCQVEQPVETEPIFL